MESRIIIFCCLLAIASSDVCTRDDCIERGLDFTHLSSPQVVALRNKALLLNCSASVSQELGPHNISWWYQGQPVDNGHCQVLANGSLYIEKVFHQKKDNGRKDDGNYTCLVHVSAGTMFSRPIEVIVARMGKSFLEEPQSYEVEEGGVARFRCQIQAVPTAEYTWQQDKKNLDAENSRFTFLSSGILQINNVTKSDEGSYRCVAKNVAKSQHSQEAILSVLSASLKSQSPQFLNPVLMPNEVKVNSDVELECLVQSFPLPHVYWTKKGKPLTLTARIIQFGQGNLKIKQLKQNDSGSYECNANVTDPVTGQSITDSQMFQITALDITPPSIEQPPLSQKKPLAKTARFECSVTGSPKPDIVWYKNAVPLAINGRIKVMTGEKSLRVDKPVPENPNVHRNELVISDTVMSDAGIYQCIATNIAGVDTAAARLELFQMSDQPSAPLGLKARTLSSKSVLLTWNPATASNNQSIQAYSVHVTPTLHGKEQTMVSVNTSIIADNLRPYTNYSFYVRAYSGKSASQPSEIVTQVTGEDIPLDAPDVKLTSLSPTIMHVSWSELSIEKARGAIISYRIQYRAHGQAFNSVIEVKANIREYLITGLEPQKKYDVRVMGGTIKGFPALSEEKWLWVTYQMPEASTQSVPLPLTLHLSVLNATTLEAAWSVVPENKLPITGFKLYYREQGDQLKGPIQLPNTTYRYILSDLAHQTWYEVHINAYNEHGDGLEVMRTIPTLPENDTIGPPQNLKAEPLDSQSIKLTWELGCSMRNISNYTIHYYPLYTNNPINSSAHGWIRSTNKEIVISNLKPFTLYGFSVRCHDTDNQQGPFSQIIECKTYEDKPSVPRDLTWLSLNVSSVRINWQPPEFPNGVIKSYFIFYQEATQDAECVETWQSKTEPGTQLTSVLRGLSINTKYSFCMQAATKAGAGSLTSSVTFQISAPSKTTRKPTQVPQPSQDDPFLGVLIGISIGIACITICALIIIFRNRCCPPVLPPDARYSAYSGNGHSSHLNGHPPFLSGAPATAERSCSDCQELESYNQLSPQTGEHHLDTKGGYPSIFCNGKINGYAHPVIANGYALHSSNGNQKPSVNITENPQCTGVDVDSCQNVPRTRMRYSASDCRVCEGWDDDNSGPVPLLSEQEESATNSTNPVDSAGQTEIPKETVEFSVPLPSADVPSSVDPNPLT